MTPPESVPPGDAPYAPPGTGRHRPGATGADDGPPHGLPAQGGYPVSARPSWEPTPPREPDSFNGFAAGGSADPGPGAERTGSAYRPLRDSTSESATGGARPGAAANPQLAEVLRGLSESAQPESKPRSTRRRLTIAGCVCVVVLLVIGIGGYVGYRLLAPYFGLGYKAGGTAVVDEVAVKVTSIDCGLDSAPFGNSGEPEGAFCGVTISARNKGQDTRFTELARWTAKLDVDLTARPDSAYLENRRYPLESGQAHEFQLVYDIPDGSRMMKIQPFVSDLSKGPVTGGIAVS